MKYDTNCALHYIFCLVADFFHTLIKISVVFARHPLYLLYDERDLIFANQACKIRIFRLNCVSGNFTTLDFWVSTAMAFGKTGIDWRSVKAAVWRSNRHYLKPIVNVDLIDPDTLLGIDDQKSAIYKNTENFLRGKPANHVLLWGARGGGKSSLIKAVLSRYHNYGLRMIQIPKNDLHLLLDITDDLHDNQHKFIIYCDDLSFDEGQGEYRLLKTMMEGNLEKPPSNVLIYATSNRRHLMPEKMSDNQSPQTIDGEIHPNEAIEEVLSLADRFGMSLSFSPMSREAYLHIVDDLFKNYSMDQETLHQDAIRFATERGGHSGRTARHFFNHSMMYL